MFLLIRFFMALMLAVWCAFPASALVPEQVLLIVNRNEPAGIELARYYQSGRQIPKANLLVVDMPTTEDCPREVYVNGLLNPLRHWLAARPDLDIRCLVTFYGLPIRVSDPLAENQQQTENQEPAHASVLSAALDSELSLARGSDYPLRGWIVNPLARPRFSPPAPSVTENSVLMVSRLDGPSPAVVRRIIADSLDAEKVGLRGRAYFDARWSAAGKGKALEGYKLYDNSLHRAADLTATLSHLDVALDEQESLFAAGEAADAALYCGWYSLARYVPAFEWRPGAVAYHMASAECVTLKKEGSQVWCKRLLEDGVAATIGPVAEPYIQGFPLPERFFLYLLDGHYTLVESYFYTLPWLSWQMMLVGDPLYRPFVLQPGVHGNGMN